MAAHEAGDLVMALSAFEAALAMAPGDARAAGACATLLFELARPQAALACLLTVESQLLTSAEGASNLAFAAAACGNSAQAGRYFSAALALEPGHVRALSHMGLMRAQQGCWEEAITHARNCLARAPEQDWAWAQLADFLMGAQRHDQALAHLAQGLRRFPGHPVLSQRQAVLLAISGDFDSADQLLTALVNARLPGQAAQGDARAIFWHHAFEALQDCDWRFQDRLRMLVQQQLRAGAQHAAGRDMRPVLACGPLLPLVDGDMQLAARALWQALSAGPAKPGRPFSPKDVLGRQGRIRIGIATQSLRDEAATAALAAQLGLHDSGSFEFFIYSPTPQPQAVLAQALAPQRVVEIAHFSDDEAIARIRLDRLDIWLDLGFGTSGWRPALAARRVAPVQLQHPGWQAQETGGPFDYALSDGFIHPVPGQDGDSHKRLIRLPHTCWPARPCSLASTTAREHAGLPPGALVLCAFAPAIHIDGHSFSVWMKLLGQLPAAVLWLPPLSVAAQRNLRREAEAAGVAAQRLCFAVAATHPDRLASLALADLFVDTLHMNARQDLGDALALGVPAISCAGSGMAARIGGSMLHAAGLGDCVVDSEQAYLDTVLRLGRDRAALQQLRGRLRANMATAPLFDLPARVRDLEAAWTWMAGRARAGLPPADFEPPAARPDPLLFS